MTHALLLYYGSNGGPQFIRSIQDSLLSLVTKSAIYLNETNFGKLIFLGFRYLTILGYFSSIKEGTYAPSEGTTWLPAAATIPQGLKYTHMSSGTSS